MFCKQKLRISCSTLDFYNSYLQANCTWIKSKEHFIEMLTTYTFSQKAQNGTDIHSFIETGKISKFLNLSDNLQNTCLEIHNQLDKATFELKTVKHYDKYNVDVVCKPDALLGDQIWEFKTTENYDYKKYLNSVQWQFYLDIFEADKITYIVLPIKEMEDKTDFIDDGKGNSGYNLMLDIIDQPYIFTFTKNDYKKTDLTNLIEDFIDFIYKENLTKHFLSK